MTIETKEVVVKSQSQIEFEKQTILLEKINSKLGIFVFVLVLYIIGSILGAILGI